MLKWIKETGRAFYGYAYFMVTGNTEKMFSEGWGGNARTKEQDVGGITRARIATTPDGKFAIVNRGETIQVYSRKRDAIRGAERRGFEVA